MEIDLGLKKAGPEPGAWRTRMKFREEFRVEMENRVIYDTGCRENFAARTARHAALEQFPTTSLRSASPAKLVEN